MDPNFHHGPETSLISDVQAIVSLMNFLTAGAAPPWKVTQSSDGVNVTTGNESVDSDAKLGKDSAWFVLEAQPDASNGNAIRSLCFQHRTEPGYPSRWNILYSRYEQFLLQPAKKGNQLPSTPKSTDVAIVGSVDIANRQGGHGAVIALGGVMRYQMAYSKTGAHGFFLYGYQGSPGTPTAGMGIVIDPIVPGTGMPGDVDPVVIYVTAHHWLPDSGPKFPFLSGDLSRSGSGTSIAGFPMGFAGLASPAVLGPPPKPEQKPTFGPIPALSYTTFIADSGGNLSQTTIVPGGLGPNLYTGQDDVLPLIYVRIPQGTETGTIKGVSTFMKWNGARISTGDTLDLTGKGTHDRITVGAVNFEWGTSGTPPTV